MRALPRPAAEPPLRATHGGLAMVLVHLAIPFLAILAITLIARLF